MKWMKIPIVLFIGIVLLFIFADREKLPTDHSSLAEQTQPPASSSPHLLPQVTSENPKDTAEMGPPLPYVSQLTGLGSEVELRQRPLVVMIENHVKARPQSGLDKADLIYEVLAEGEITRFISVFHSQSAEIIGPVRSIRPYFVQLGNALDGVLVHAGWSQDAMDMMVSKKAAHLDELYGDGGNYWRSADRKPPHNLYTSTDKMNQGIANRKFRLEWKPNAYSFVTEKRDIIEGTSATRIDIPYILGYHVAYEYDPNAQVYLRAMNNEPHLDRETGKQLSAANVLVIASKHKIVDDVGRRQVDVIGPGKGMIFQQGKMREISWELKNGLIRAYIDGQEVSMIPGVTWVQIVPLGTVTKIED